MKRKSIIWVIIFLVIIASPSAVYFFLGKYLDTANYENRTKAEKPVLTTDNFEAFPQEYENYYNDNIPFRNQLIALNNSIDYFLFHQSSNDRVAIGEDDWLFYSDNNDGNPVEQSLGYWLFTKKELAAIAYNLEFTERLLKNQGIEFVLFIAPNKETIYKEKIPGYYKEKTSYTSMDQLVDYLKENTNIRVVCPKDKLMDAKKRHPDLLFYYKLDTHWNNVGAYVGAAALADELGVQMPSLEEVSLKSDDISLGDLANMLNISIKNGDIKYTVGNHSNDLIDHIQLYHMPDGDLRRLFVKRDSFATALAPSLVPFFQDSFFVHHDSYDQQQVFDYGADVFVLEIVERHIKSLTSFKVSYVSYTVGNDGESGKNIAISPTIKDKSNQYISVFKKADGAKKFSKHESLRPFTDTVNLQVPKGETGEVQVHVFENTSDSAPIEKVVIQY